MRIVVVLAVVGMATCVSVGTARADRFCAVPLADWQPRETLQARLEAQGLTVLGIRTDDGCYKVLARTADGEVVKGRYDPATLEPVGRGGHGRRWRGGRGDDGHGDDDRD